MIRLGGQQQVQLEHQAMVVQPRAPPNPRPNPEPALVQLAQEDANEPINVEEEWDAMNEVEQKFYVERVPLIKEEYVHRVQQDEEQAQLAMDPSQGVEWMRAREIGVILQFAAEVQNIFIFSTLRSEVDPIHTQVRIYNMKHAMYRTENGYQGLLPILRSSRVSVEDKNHEILRRFLVGKFHLYRILATVKRGFLTSTQQLDVYALMRSSVLSGLWLEAIRSLRQIDDSNYRSSGMHIRQLNEVTQKYARDLETFGHAVRRFVEHPLHYPDEVHSFAFRYRVFIPVNMVYDTVNEPYTSFVEMCFDMLRMHNPKSTDQLHHLLVGAPQVEENAENPFFVERMIAENSIYYARRARIQFHIISAYMNAHPQAQQYGRITCKEFFDAVGRYDYEIHTFMHRAFSTIYQNAMSTSTWWRGAFYDACQRVIEDPFASVIMVEYMSFKRSIERKRANYIRSVHLKYLIDVVKQHEIFLSAFMVHGNRI